MYYFIMNPAASSGQGRKVWKRLKPVLNKKRVKYNLISPDDKEELIQYIKTLTGRAVSDDAKDKPDGYVIRSVVNDIENNTENNIKNNKENHTEQQGVHIVVLGGDGTLNLVLNSIVDMEHTKLSCIRVGSGNDFARNVGVCKNPEKALLHLLDSPCETELDYGEAEYITIKGERRKRRFIISSGIGYDADICEEVSRSRLKRILNTLHLGKLVYVAIGVKQIFTRRNTKVKIYIDDKLIRSRNLFFVVGMIHKMEGGGVPFCPHAGATDGMLDICVAKGAPVSKLLLEVGMVYLKKHLLFSNIAEYKCRRLRVVVEKAQWIHMDGETPCRVREAVLKCEQGLRFVK